MKPGDDFGVTNPIGAAEHKMFALYMDVDSTRFCTKANKMPLVVLCDRSKVKDLHQVFGPVRRDLKKLMASILTLLKFF